MTNEMVSISKEEYEILLSRIDFLNCLEACGVDNWEGYGDACDFFNGED